MLRLATKCSNLDKSQNGKTLLLRKGKCPNVSETYQNVPVFCLVDMPLFIGFERMKCSSRGEINDFEAYLTPAFRHLFTKWKITNKFTQTTMFLIVFMFFFINIAHFPNNTL